MDVRVSHTALYYPGPSFIVSTRTPSAQSGFLLVSFLFHDPPTLTPSYLVIQILPLLFPCSFECCYCPGPGSLSLCQGCVNPESSQPSPLMPAFPLHSISASGTGMSSTFLHLPTFSSFRGFSHYVLTQMVSLGLLPTSVRLGVFDEDRT